MRFWRARWFWALAALVAGAWAVRAMSRQGAHQQNGRSTWWRVVDPKALQPAVDVAARAGQAVVKGTRRVIGRD